MVQLVQKLLIVQRLLVFRQLLRQTVLAYASCGLDQSIPLEFRDESLDEVEVRFRWSDLKLNVLEDEREVVFCAVFWKGEIRSSESSLDAQYE